MGSEGREGWAQQAVTPDIGWGEHRGRRGIRTGLAVQDIHLDFIVRAFELRLGEGEEMSGPTFGAGRGDHIAVHPHELVPCTVPRGTDNHQKAVLLGEEAGLRIGSAI